MDLGKVTVFSGSPPDKKRLLQTCRFLNVEAKCLQPATSSHCRRYVPGAALLALKWQWDEPYNERGSNSGVRPTRGRPILKIVCLLTGIPMAVGAAFMCVLSTFLPCFFYLDENFLYGESRLILSQRSHQMEPHGAHAIRVCMAA